MRVRVVRATVGDGGRVLEVGEVLAHLSDCEAHLLIAMRRAEPVLDVPEGGMPLPRHDDPAPTRRRKER